MRRIYFYVSKTDPAECTAFFGEQVDARARADETLGLVNWTEYEMTRFLGAAFAAIVNLARERVPTRDGTGRWRWRTVANVIKAWLGEPTDETCASCGQQVPTPTE